MVTGLGHLLCVRVYAREDQGGDTDLSHGLDAPEETEEAGDPGNAKADNEWPLYHSEFMDS